MSTAPRIALMAALPLPAEAGAPEWVHLLPAGQRVETFDGRGPYVLGDAAAIIAASAEDPRGLPIDENHATDLAAPKGGAAPARGWIVELQARADGIWGRVEWTREGAALVADRAYRGLSPVLAIDAKDRRTIRGIRRASLVNLPNLRDLTALHQEDPSMTFMEQLAEKLGLAKDATEDQLLAAIPAQTDTALQSALAEIGTALGVEGGETAAIVAAAKGARAAKPAEIAALQSELAGVSRELAALKDAGARTKAETFVDGEIAKGRVGVKPLRDHYITRHMANPAEVEKELGALPVLAATGALATPPAPTGEITALNAEQARAADLLGQPHDLYLATLKAEQKDHT